MAGPVSRYVQERLRHQVGQSGLVVWFDPDRTYLSLVSEWGAQDIPVEAYADSLLDLRRRVEPYITPYDCETGDWRDRPDNVVAYVPLDPVRIGDALVDLTECGIVLAPGQHPWQRNMSLATVARQALRDYLPAGELDRVISEVEHGQLNLDDLDRLGERGGQAEFPQVALIFDHSDPHEVALQFLSSPAKDDEIVQREALGQLGNLLSAAFELPEFTDQSPAALRTRFGRYLLLADLVLSLGDHAPESLRGIHAPRNKEGRRAIKRVVSTWRNRQDLVNSYVACADEAGSDVGSSVFSELSFDALSKLETFRESEQALQARAAEGLRHQAEATSEMLSETDRRLKMVWARHEPGIRERWQIILDAGRLIRLARAVESEIPRSRPRAVELFNRYVSGDSPWYLLDTHHRHMLALYYELDFSADEIALQGLVTEARSRYDHVVMTLTDRFVTSLREAGFSVEGVQSQRDVFRQYVRRALDNGSRTAYLLVDALRFEMAQELVSWELPGWNAEITPSLGTFPSVTEVGMAGLMPGADRDLTLTGSGRGRGVDVVVSGTTVVTRQQRLDALNAALPEGWVHFRLEEIAPISANRFNRLKDAPAAVITSRELDELGEAQSGGFARQTMGIVLRNLVRGFATLRSAAFDRIIVASDHGYLFGEGISAGQKIDAPGGEVFKLNPRVWIGRGGSRSDGVLRLEATDLGIGGDLEFATPIGSGVFAAPGASGEYFHGGLSLQEIVIPVIELASSDQSSASTTSATLDWDIKLGSETIGTRFFSVTVSARTQEFLPVSAPQVQVDLRHGQERIAEPVTASYGFEESGTVSMAKSPGDSQQIEPNTITFLLSQDAPAEGVASIVILDAGTGREIGRRDGIPVDLAF